MSVRNIFYRIRSRHLASRIALCFLLVCGLLITLRYYIDYRVDPCRGKESTALFQCHEAHLQYEEVHAGLPGAFEYLHSVLLEDANFPVMHLVLHDLGHYAYHASGSDIEHALVSFAKSFPNWRLDFTLDGYRHGALMAFFQHNKSLGVDTLVHRACNAYLLMAQSSVIGTQATTSQQCFDALGDDLFLFSHGLGHAFMEMENYDTPSALTDCDTLPKSYMQNACTYGVFMEISYLFQPLYNPTVSRLALPSTGFADFCNSLAPRYIPSCARLVARSYLIVTSQMGDFNGAFQECRKLAPQYRQYCAYDGAAIYIPRFFKSDTPAMLAQCLSAGDDLAGSCIDGVAWSIKNGGAGLGNNRDMQFCPIVPAQFRASCDCARQALGLSVACQTEAR